jgi:hypothetical protein
MAAAAPISSYDVLRTRLSVRMFSPLILSSSRHLSGTPKRDLQNPRRPSCSCDERPRPDVPKDFIRTTRKLVVLAEAIVDALVSSLGRNLALLRALRRIKLDALNNAAAGTDVRVVRQGNGSPGKPSNSVRTQSGADPRPIRSMLEDARSAGLSQARSHRWAPHVKARAAEFMEGTAGRRAKGDCSVWSARGQTATRSIFVPVHERHSSTSSGIIQQDLQRLAICGCHARANVRDQTRSIRAAALRRRSKRAHRSRSG